MSKQIGQVDGGPSGVFAYVSVSGAGVEIYSDESFTLSPEQAADYAALLIRAACVRVEDERAAINPTIITQAPRMVALQRKKTT